MTRTIFRVALFLLLYVGMSGTTIAGVHKDYYGRCAGNCEMWSEATTSFERYFENDNIYYDTAVVCDLLPSHATHYDNREELIRKFFMRHKSPAAKYAKLFVQVADENNLDWKLLPTLAFIESTGGKFVSRRNNIFGWDSGKARFPTVEDAIRQVGKALTKGPYKNTTMNQKLHVYNSHPTYYILFYKVMKSIGA